MRRLILVALITALPLSAAAQEPSTVGAGATSSAALQTWAFSKIIGTVVADSNGKRFGLVSNILRDANGVPSHYQVSVGYNKFYDYPIESMTIIPGSRGGPDEIRLK